MVYQDKVSKQVNGSSPKQESPYWLKERNYSGRLQAHQVITTPSCLSVTGRGSLVEIAPPLTTLGSF